MIAEYWHEDSFFHLFHPSIHSSFPPAFHFLSFLPFIYDPCFFLQPSFFLLSLPPSIHLSLLSLFSSISPLVCLSLLPSFIPSLFFSVLFHSPIIHLSPSFLFHPSLPPSIHSSILPFIHPQEEVFLPHSLHLYFLPHFSLSFSSSIHPSIVPYFSSFLPFIHYPCFFSILPLSSILTFFMFLPPTHPPSILSSCFCSFLPSVLLSLLPSFIPSLFYSIPPFIDQSCLF